jgi:hypothetical protein
LQRGLPFVLPNSQERWDRVFDTADRDWDRRFSPRGKVYRLRAFGVAVFRLVAAAAA